MEHKTSMDKPTKSKVLYILAVILNLFHMKKLQNEFMYQIRK
jgi:hypothetical protein